jgi:flagellar biosynthesis/type III secretory pathway protein FliH
MAANRTSFADIGLALFARDFDDPDSLGGVIVLDEPEPADTPAEPEPPPITAAMLDEARAAGFAEGLRHGRAEAAAARDAERDAMVAALLAGLRDADAKLHEAVEAAGSRLAGLVLAMLEAGFPTLCARHGAAELSRFTRETIALLGQEPRIVIRIHPALQPAVEAVVAELEPERRTAILVEPREALPPGDGRIAWRHGLASRDTTALRTRLAEILAPLGLTPSLADAGLVAADSLSHD